MNQGTTKNGQGLPERQPLLSVVLFHPDYTVGFGIAPKSADLSGKPESARGLAPDIFRHPVITAGGELHPALRTLARAIYPKVLGCQSQIFLILGFPVDNIFKRLAALEGFDLGDNLRNQRRRAGACGRMRRDDDLRMRP